MKKLLREPLMHFLLLGGLLFIFHALWSVWVTRADRQLVVNTQEIARQSDLFAIENGRPPNNTELQGIIVAYVEEEVMAREAQSLGLDVDDTVIRRRLAQKMRLLTDAGAVAPLDDADLKDWFEARRDDYVVPERRLLQHVFFSDDRRDDPRTDALAADLEDWTRVGDPFIIARTIGPVDRAKLQQDYGGAFARAAFESEIGAWTEPVRSPFGIHRIRVTESLSRQEADFDRDREAVLEDWLRQARQDRARLAVRDMVSRYDVIVEE